MVNFKFNILSNDGLFILPDAITIEEENTVIRVDYAYSFDGWGVCNENLDNGVLKMAFTRGRNTWPAFIRISHRKENIKEIVIVGRRNEEEKRVVVF